MKLLLDFGMFGRMIHLVDLAHVFFSNGWRKNNEQDLTSTYSYKSKVGKSKI